MKTRTVALMWVAKIGYIVMSLVFCAVGVLFIIYPEISAMTATRILGAAMAIFGTIKLVGYFSRDLYRLAFQFDLQFGILLLALGGILLVRPRLMLSFVIAVIGVCVITDALFKVETSLQAKRFGIGAWWLILTAAIITAGIGFLLLCFPKDGAVFLTLLSGVSLLLEGILNLCVAVTTVKIIKHQKPDVIEVDYEDV